MIKKSQITSNPIIIFLIVIIIVLTVFLSIGGIKDFNSNKKRAEADTFVFTLENTLKNQNSKTRNSVDYVTLSLPLNIEKVCFVDDEEQFSPHTVLELSREKEIYQESNLFFFPSDQFSPMKIDLIRLNESENPLCVNTVGGKLNLKLTTLTNKVLIESVDGKGSGQNCIIVPGSKVGDPDEKIDVLFLGFGYKNKTSFAEEVDDYIANYLFEIEPFRSNKDKFNFWMIDKGQPDCTITSYVFCDLLTVNKLASDCPHDYIFVLVDKRRIGGTVRSSAVSNVAKLNTRDNKLVLVHEFGHTFGGLADEYADKYYEEWFDAKDYPNCDYRGCDSWNDLNGTECIKGCSTNQFYRSVDISIMRNYDRSESFGVLNEKILSGLLEEYK